MTATMFRLGVFLISPVLLQAGCFDFQKLSAGGPLVDGGKLPDLLAHHDAAEKPDFVTTGDMTPLLPRFIFITPMKTQGSLGGVDSAHKLCQAAGMSTPHGGASFLALIGDGNNGPFDYLANYLKTGREITLPDGITRVATDATLFGAGDHLNAINQMPDKTKVIQECVWTNFDAKGKSMSGSSCTPKLGAAWQSNLKLDKGSTGSTLDVTTKWAADTTVTCDMSCFLYCIEL